MTIQTKPTTPEYSEGWDRIFGKKKSTGSVLCAECGKSLEYWPCPECFPSQVPWPKDKST